MDNPVGKHTYTSVCDSCRHAKDVTLSTPASTQFQTLPKGWEIIFVEYQTLREQFTHQNDNKRIWLRLCQECKPKENTPTDVVKEDDRRWFTKLFRAGRFGKTSAQEDSSDG